MFRCVRLRLQQDFNPGKKIPRIPIPGMNGDMASISERASLDQQTKHRDLITQQSRERYKIEPDTAPAAARFIGIDLGTTNSCVSYIDLKTKRPKIIPSPSGSWVFPTAITFEQAKEKRTFGEYSRSQAHISGQCTITSGKRLIGRRFGELEKVSEHMRKLNTISINETGELCININGKLISVVHITGMFLRYIKNEAEAFLKEPVGGVVVSVPAYFTPQQKVATEDAAVIAGFDVLEVIDEPTAACLTYTLLSEQQAEAGSSYKLVFDLGGGTLDCALMLHNHADHSFKLVSTHGDALLGGNDWDQLLCRHFSNEFLKKWKIDLLKEAETSSIPSTTLDQRLLMLEAEKAKIHFTNSADVYRGYQRAFYFSAIAKEIIPLDTQLTLKEYLDLTEPLRTRCVQCLDQLFASTTVKPGQVDQVLLVGGMTRDPPVRMMLEQYFGKKVMDEGHCPADYAVAIGAAIRGGMLKGIYPQLSDKTEFVAGTTQANASGGVVKRLVSRLKALRNIAPTALGIKWRGRAKGLSDAQIQDYAMEIVTYEMKQLRFKQLADAEESANAVMQRVAADSTKRHDQHDKTIKTLVEQLKFWQYMVTSFRDHEEHLLRTVDELTAAMNELQGNTNDAELGPSGTIDFETAKATTTQNVYKSQDPYTSAMLDREVREKRMQPMVEPADDPTKIVVGGPKILRRRLPLPGNDQEVTKKNVLHSGHMVVSVDVPEPTRVFLLKHTVDQTAWQEPPPPEGEEGTGWRAVQDSLVNDAVPVGQPLFEPIEEHTLEQQLAWLLQHAAIEEKLTDAQHAKKEETDRLSTMMVVK